MSSIKILPEQVFNKIAAGEVIARPASVVKELVENSIDAGATKIIVQIENAGSKLISVTDDGHGMDADDALLCLEPHATSKITREADINQIFTFGFRGEAMPSMASVSRFSIKTRQPDSIEGTEVIVDGGKFIRSAPTGCAPGTEIMVKDLFFNTPARKKFLKSPATEEKHIHETIISLALPYPSISFELIIDGRMAISSPAFNDLKPRMKAFFGSSYEQSMLPIKFKEHDFTVGGFISRHGYTRNSRKEQRVFVNGRAVEALAAYHGIREGYGSLVPKGKYPPVILFLHMDPFLVDVNVHPAKKEVRFRQERVVSGIISKAIKALLRTSSMPTMSVDPELSLNSILHGAEVNYSVKEEHPELDLGTAPVSSPSSVSIPAPMPTAVETTPIVNTAPMSPVQEYAEEEPGQVIEDVIDNETIAVPEENNVPVPKLSPKPTSMARTHSNSQETTEYSTPAPITTPTANVASSETPVSQSAPVPSVENRDICEVPGSGPLEIMGFIDNAYIVAQAETGLVVIDQHAAHERVLFEQLLQNSKHDHASQRLLLPITVELTRSETLFLEKYNSHFNDLGFDLEPFGNNTILIHEIPSMLPQENIGNFISDLLEELADNQEIKRKFDVSVIAMKACKKAVKAHDDISISEAKNLIRQMGQCELPYSCPHGRPTIINISMKELEKRFGRH